MHKILNWIRQSILNSLIYNFIANMVKIASGAYFFTPQVYSGYSQVGEVSDKSLFIRWFNKFDQKMEGLYEWIRKTVDHSFFIGLFKMAHDWLSNSRVYSWLCQFNLVYLLILYVYVDRGVRTFLVPLSSVWDELLLLTFAGWILVRRILFKKKYYFTRLDIPLISFILVYTSITFIYSPDLGIGIEGLRAVVQYMLWYFMIVQMVDSESVLERVLMLMVFSVGLLGAHGTWQYFTGAEMLGNWVDSSESIQTRAYSIVGGPNTLGSLMVINIPIAFGMFIVEKDIIKKILYMVSTLFMGLGLIFTFSRGAWLAAFIGIIIMFVFLAKRMIISITTVLLAAVMSIDTIWNRIYYMFTKEYISKASTGGRLYRWQYALEEWQERPLFGLGVGRFGGAVATNHNLTPFYMDNYYLKTLTESGIIGLTAFVLLVLSSVWNMILYIRGTLDQRYRIIMISIFSGAIGLLIHNGVENIFESPFSVVYFWTYVGLLVAIHKIERSKVK